MKYLLFFISVFLFVSCGNTSNSEQNDQSSDEKSEQIEKSEKKDVAKGDCEEFLDDYEKWVDDVIKVYKAAMENPMDMQNTQKMMDATNKMAEWSEKWTKLYDCANDEKYAKRMDELQEKVNKAMEE